MTKIDEAERMMRAHFHSSETNTKVRAKHSLLMLVLTLLDFCKIGDLGIAGIEIYGDSKGTVIEVAKI